jgi:ribosomal protein S18 acetylase RimI-like enzyme
LGIRLGAARPCSWEEYREAWLRCMGHLHWFGSHRLFGYDPREELESMEGAFRGDGLFLIASSGDGCRAAGVLGIAPDGCVGRIRPWEPGVPLELAEAGVGELLLEAGSELAQNSGLEVLSLRFRYLVDLLGSAAWLEGIYRGAGFSQVGPLGLMMVADLKYELGGLDLPGMEVTGREGLGVEDLVDLTLRAFTEDPGDRGYFSWDPVVTTREGAEDFFEPLVRGEKGASTPELSRVAWVGGEPAGLVGSYVPELGRGPLHGVVGPVGVIPEHRRRGIGRALLLDLLGILRSRGCSHAYLNTHVDNGSAVALYRGVGFEPAYHFLILERDLGR